MPQRQGEQQFLEDVFPAELEEIRRRRETLDLPPLPDGPSTDPQEPSPQLGLIGLALSGGGIRSATFSLGAIQALARHGILKRIDYLSTVSGGGFIGSCLSTALNTPLARPEDKNFPLGDEIGSPETAVVSHLRNSSNYLASRGFLDKIRIPAIVLRGIITNLLLFLPILMVAVFATEFAYEAAYNFYTPLDMPLSYYVLGVFALFLAMVLFYPLAARSYSHWSNWKGRDRGENLFALVLVAVLIVLFMVATYLVVDRAVQIRPDQLVALLRDELRNPFQTEDIWKWLLGIGVFVLFMSVSRIANSVSKIGGQILLILVGLVGPAILAILFLVMVVYQVDSPLLENKTVFTLKGSVAEKFDKSAVGVVSDIRDLDSFAGFAGNPEMRQEAVKPWREYFEDSPIPLSGAARVVAVKKGKRWVILDKDQNFHARLVARDQHDNLPKEEHETLTKEEHAKLVMGKIEIAPFFELDLSRAAVKGPEKDVVSPALQQAILTAKARVWRWNSKVDDPCDKKYPDCYRISGNYEYNITARKTGPVVVSWEILYTGYPGTTGDWKGWASKDNRPTPPQLRDLFGSAHITVTDSATVQQRETAQDVVVVIDNSASLKEFVKRTMKSEKGPWTNISEPEKKLNAWLESGLKRFCRNLAPGSRLALVRFNKDGPQIKKLDAKNCDALEASFGGDKLTGNNPYIWKEMRDALQHFKSEEAKKHFESIKTEIEKSIVLVSDGHIKNEDQKEVQEEIRKECEKQGKKNWEECFALDAAAAGIRVYGLAVPQVDGKTEGPANLRLFNSLARESRGGYMEIRSKKDLPAIDGFFGRAIRGWEVKNEGITYVLRLGTGTFLLETTLVKAKGALKEIQDVEEELLKIPTLEDRPFPEKLRDSLKDAGIPLKKKAFVFKLENAEIDGNPPGIQRWRIKVPYDYKIIKQGDQLELRHMELFDGNVDIIFFAALGVLMLHLLLVEVNLSSIHRFYRDRLSKAYLVQPTESGSLDHKDKLKLSGLNAKDTAAPYHLINAALNLQASPDPSLRGRNADFFVFSKKFVGSARTGYIATPIMEDKGDPNLSLATAMAISGAAAAPNMGAITTKRLVFLLTLLNIRLGYWLPNPRMLLRDHGRVARSLLTAGASARYLFYEALGWLNARGSHVNVSDGGHLENLGLYELLRRRCKLIISVDGEADPNFQFDGLVKLMVYARIDLGIDIRIDLDEIRTVKNGVSARNWAVGDIDYGNGEKGKLLYLKSSNCRDETEYVRSYRESNIAFPHESTADQFFNETQFEAYRALGYCIADNAFSNTDVLEPLADLTDPVTANR